MNHRTWNWGALELLPNIYLKLGYKTGIGKEYSTPIGLPFPPNPSPPQRTKGFVIRGSTPYLTPPLPTVPPPRRASPPEPLSEPPTTPHAINKQPLNTKTPKSHQNSWVGGRRLNRCQFLNEPSTQSTLSPRRPPLRNATGVCPVSPLPVQLPVLYKDDIH